MPKPPMRLALLGHSEVEPTCYPHFLKYHPFPFHHFSPSTTINNFQVHHPFMYTTSTKNSLHLSSSLFHLSLDSKTRCYKKNPSNLFASTSLPKSLMYGPLHLSLKLTSSRLLSQQPIFFFFIHTLWIYEVFLLLYFYSIFPCSLLLCNKDLAFLIFIGIYNV